MSSFPRLCWLVAVTPWLVMMSCGGRTAAVDAARGDANPPVPSPAVDGGDEGPPDDPRGHGAALELAKRWLSAQSSGYGVEFDEADPARGFQTGGGCRQSGGVTCSTLVSPTFQIENVVSLFFQFACERSRPNPTNEDLQRALQRAIIDLLTIDVGARGWTFRAVTPSEVTGDVTMVSVGAGRARVRIDTTIEKIYGLSADQDCQTADGMPEFCLVEAPGPISLTLTVDAPFDTAGFSPMPTFACP